MKGYIKLGKPSFFVVNFTVNPISLLINLLKNNKILNPVVLIKLMADTGAQRKQIQTRGAPFATKEAVMFRDGGWKVLLVSAIVMTLVIILLVSMGAMD